MWHSIPTEGVINRRVISLYELCTHPLELYSIQLASITLRLPNHRRDHSGYELTATHQQMVIVTALLTDLALWKTKESLI